MTKLEWIALKANGHCVSGKSNDEYHFIDNSGFESQERLWTFAFDSISTNIALCIYVFIYVRRCPRDAYWVTSKMGGFCNRNWVLPIFMLINRPHVSIIHCCRFESFPLSAKKSENYILIRRPIRPKTHNPWTFYGLAICLLQILRQASKFSMSVSKLDRFACVCTITRRLTHDKSAILPAPFGIVFIRAKQSKHRMDAKPAFAVKASFRHTPWYGRRPWLCIRWRMWMTTTLKQSEKVRKSSR